MFFVTAYIQSSCQFLQTQAYAITDLSKCYTIQISDELDDSILNSCVTDSSFNTKIFLKVPEELRKNLELDMPNMLKKKEKLIKELEQINKVMSGEKYLLRAPPEQQEQNARKVNI